MTNESLYVLQEKHGRLSGLYNACDLEEESSSGILEPLPKASDGKRLAREAAEQDVVFGNVPKVDLRNIAGWLLAKVRLIRLLRELVPFRREYALPAESLEGKSNAAHTCEQIDKPKNALYGHLKKNPDRCGSEGGGWRTERLHSRSEAEPTAPQSIRDVASTRHQKTAVSAGDRSLTLGAHGER
jgi:hypothetical protein